MNVKTFMVLAVMGLGLLAWAVTAQEQTAAKKAAPGPDAFMLAKLEHAKRVLEGLTTENFDLVARNAQAMTLLSLERGWQVLQTEEYLQRSAEFRRTSSALTEASKNRNLDGATLAYVDLTMKCVECHKYVRQVRVRESSP
jgi:hypothetical protein